MLPYNLAHRGFSGKYPENTMLAFQKAIDEGHCDGFETDIHMSADGELVVIHDAVLDRTTSGIGAVRNLSYQKLRELDAGIKKGNEFAGQRIPHLTEVLELVKQYGLKLNIELKNYETLYPGMEKKLIELVHNMGLMDSVMLSSFNHQSMVDCKKINPAVYTGLLYSQPMYRAEEYAKTCCADALHPQFRLSDFDPKLFERCRHSGVDINVWTINEREGMEDMVSKDVKAVITNFPDRLHEVIKNRGRKSVI